MASDTTPSPAAIGSSVVASIPPAAVVAVPGRAQGAAALFVGGSDDPLEHAAELVADQVVRRLARAPDPDLDPAAERASAPAAGAFPRGEIGPAGGELDCDLSTRLTSARGGRPLAPQVRRRMESGFGRSLGHVRIHADHESTTLARSMSASAFTLRNDIYLDTDVAAPGSPGYDRVLAHEIAHTLQPSGKVDRLIRNAGRSDSDHPRADVGNGTVPDAPLVVRRAPPVTARAVQALPRAALSFFRRSDGEIETLGRGLRWGSQTPVPARGVGPTSGRPPWRRPASTWSNPPATATGPAGPGFAPGRVNAWNLIGNRRSIASAFLERFRRPANSDESDRLAYVVEPESLLSEFGPRSSGTGPSLSAAVGQSLMASIEASPQGLVTSDGSIDIDPGPGPGPAPEGDSDPLADVVEPETLLSEFGPRSSGTGPSLTAAVGQSLMASIEASPQGLVTSDGSIDIDPGPGPGPAPEGDSDPLADVVGPETLSEFGPRSSGNGPSDMPTVAGVLQLFQVIAESQMFTTLVSVCPALEGVQRLVDMAVVRNGGSQQLQAASNTAQGLIHMVNGDLTKVVADVATVQANLATHSAEAGAAGDPVLRAADRPEAP